jgi:hypothetical protein
MSTSEPNPRARPITIVSTGLRDMNGILAVAERAR